MKNLHALFSRHPAPFEGGKGQIGGGNQNHARSAGLFLALASLTACSAKPPSSSQEELQKQLGHTLAAVTVQNLDGHPQKLNDPLILNGKPAIINVWATWCTPCLEELPALDALGRQKNYTVIAIATDSDVMAVKQFLQQQHWGPGVQVLFDPLGQITRDQLGATVLPVTLVTDPSLTVKRAEAGPRAWDSPAMANKLKDALK